MPGDRDRQITISLKPELRRQIVAAAEEEELPLSLWCRRALSRALRDRLPPNAIEVGPGFKISEGPVR